MNKVINISSNGIKQALDDLLDENERLKEAVDREVQENTKLKDKLEQQNIEAGIEIDRLNKSLEEQRHFYLEEIEKLTAESTEWESKCYHYQDIINELEKYLNEQIQKSWEIEEQCYEDIENKLQKLKGDSSNE